MPRRATSFALGKIMVGPDPGVAAAIARLEARLDGQDASISEIKADVKSLVAAWNSASGGWKIAVVIGCTVSGVLGAFAAAWGVFHK